MNSPYTDRPQDAFAAAQFALGVVTTTLVGSQAKLSKLARAAFITSLWIAIESAKLSEFVRAMHAGPTPLPFTTFLFLSRVLAGVAGVLSLRSSRATFAAVIALGVAILHWAGANVTDSELELVAAHTAFVPVVLGIVHASALQTKPQALSAEPARERVHDAMLGLLAFGVGTLVSIFVLERQVDSSDEWAYTYQAAAFAKGHLYGKVPPCLDALRNFWIFWKDDRMFAQYQPGWPLFMAPFIWLHAEFLAAPVSFALLVVGVARLGRRASGALGHGSRNLGGLVAGLFTIFANTLMINAGSRFLHIFVCAHWAWMLEGACLATEEPGASGGAEKRARKGALITGAALGALVLTRAPEALFFESAVLLFALVSLVRRKLPVRALPWAIIPALVGALILLGISKAQVGVWFKLPYQLTSDFHPWNVVKYSAPPPNMIKWALPLATGAYSFWPLAPGLGLGGLFLLLRTRERRLAFMLVIGTALALGYYGALEIGRGSDFGYGPRYQMHLVVPMAVGSAALFARVLARNGNAKLPRWLIATASAIGVVQIALLTFPYNHALLVRNGAPMQAAKAAHLERAIVRIRSGTWTYGNMDATRNLPIELYDPNVIYVGDISPGDMRCMREHFPDRKVYRTSIRGAETTLELEP